MHQLFRQPSKQPLRAETRDIGTKLSEARFTIRARRVKSHAPSLLQLSNGEFIKLRHSTNRLQRHKQPPYNLTDPFSVPVPHYEPFHKVKKSIPDLQSQHQKRVALSAVPIPMVHFVRKQKPRLSEHGGAVPADLRTRAPRRRQRGAKEDVIASSLRLLQHPVPSRLLTPPHTASPSRFLIARVRQAVR